MCKGVYKSSSCRDKMMSLYDKQMESLNIEYEDVYVDTRFGKSHLIKTGNPEGKPILIFHGGNSTTPYSLRSFLSLRKERLIYAVDTIGQPGKSSEYCLSPSNLEYGIWASDVIHGLGLGKVDCLGGSFGGGILAKLMCFAPEKISRAILIVPSGFSNTSNIGMLIKMGIPMIFYISTRKDKWLERSILPMALRKDEIDYDTVEMVKNTFENVCVKSRMPSSIKSKDMTNFAEKTLLIAGEKDILFPGRKVIKRAKRLIPDIKTHLMMNCGHMNASSSEEHKRIMTLINEFLVK